MLPARLSQVRSSVLGEGGLCTEYFVPLQAGGALLVRMPGRLNGAQANEVVVQLYDLVDSLDATFHLSVEQQSAHDFLALASAHLRAHRVRGLDERGFRDLLRRYRLYCDAVLRYLRATRPRPPATG